MIDKQPELRDEVKHKISDMTGMVITKYSKDGKYYLDVVGVNNSVYYDTPMENWEVVKVCDE